MRGQVLEIDRRHNSEVDTAGGEHLCGAGRVDPAEHVALADWMHLGGPGGDDHIVGVHVEHVAVCQPGDHHRARVDADHVVTQLAGEHRDSRPSPRAASAAVVPEFPAPMTTTSARSRRTEAGVWLGDATGLIGGSRCSGGAPTAGCRFTRRPGCAAVRHVRVNATPSISAQQLPQSPARHSVPAMLRVLAGAHDRHHGRIAFGVLDGLVVDHDAHAWPTVANRPFPARLCCE